MTNLTEQIYDYGHLGCGTMYFGGQALQVLRHVLPPCGNRMNVTAGSYRTSYVTSNIITKISSFSLLLQFIITQSKLQIAHSKTSFQEKPKRQMEEESFI